MHRTDKYSQLSSIIWSVWPNGWVFVSSCSHLNFKNPFQELINDSHKMYGSWNMMCNRHNFLSFLDCFLLFYSSPLTNQKIKILKKMKKLPGDIIILQRCTINDNPMMYGSWDTKHDRQNFFSFWIIFLPFYPPNNLKNQNFEKMKKMPGHIITLQRGTKNHDHMLQCFLDMEHNRCNCYFSFWAIFLPFYLPNAPKKSKFKKMKKNPGDIIIVQ